MKKIIKMAALSIFLLSMIFIFIHFYLIDRLGFWRLIYPLQAQIASTTSRCSPQAPVWMKDVLRFTIKEQKNLSNQIAFIDKNHQLHHCESGWHGSAVFAKELQPEDRFRYASLTKILTSHAILDLIRQKGLTLETHLINVFEELKHMDYLDPRIKKITLGHLLEHRSGFDRLKSEDVVFSIDKKSWCPYELKALATQSLDFDPDSKYAYDNRNYCLLGAIIERLSGQPYRSYMENKYNLVTRNIKFINGQYFSDEVRYDFRNNNFWLPNDDNRFDFNALSSSAGLSGSALSLAQLLDEVILNNDVEVFSISPKAKEKCNISQFDSCNGYTFWQYQSNNSQPSMYFRSGGLPAMTGLVVVTKQKEVIVWLGNGAKPYGNKHHPYFLENHFYKTLIEKL